MIHNKIEELKVIQQKKGNLSMLKEGVVALVFIAILGGAGAIALTSFRDTQTLNSAAYNVSANGLTGTLNASAQFGTIGTLLGVAALVSVVVGAFYIAQR